MIDIKTLSTNKGALIKKGVSEETIEELEKLYSEYLMVLKQQESKQSELNILSKNYKENAEKCSEVKSELLILKNQLTVAKAKYELILFGIPNYPSSDVPEGLSEDDNKIIRYILEPKEFTAPKNHMDITDEISSELGAKLAGSRFSVLSGRVAKLERALINYMLDYNSKAGYSEVSVPYIVNDTAMFGTGQLPKFEEDLYCVDDMYLIPTAEVPLTNLYADMILDKADLPIMLTAHTPSFRKEAGSGGKDTVGIFRQHQFHKVEIVQITDNESSDEALSDMVDHVSGMLVELGLPHRIVDLCGGDLGFSANRTFDIEVYIPSQGKYREISSISNMTDFQSRRAKIRYKDDGNKLCHTLNGSSLAVGRTIIAIMENFQTEQEFEIPECLKKYL